MNRVGTGTGRITRVPVLSRDAAIDEKTTEELLQRLALSPEQKTLFRQRLPEYRKLLDDLQSPSPQLGADPRGPEYQGKHGMDALTEYFKNSREQPAADSGGQEKNR
jgi:hypothetical protein